MVHFTGSKIKPTKYQLVVSQKNDPRPKYKMNVQLHWINLFSNSSWIKTTASGLSYELDVNGEKKVNGKKTDIAHFTLVNLEVLTV